MSQVFGLGLVLNFTDNATAGMQSATNTFLGMSTAMNDASNATNSAVAQIATGTVLNTAGNALTSFGNKGIGVLQNLMNNVKSVGSDFQLFGVTLEQIYGSAEEAQNQISKLMDFSVKSPFEVADTKDLLVTLKSQGIEAFDSIKGSISGTEQQTLQWLSDLMAFKPEVPMQKWKLAFQNFLGSGETKMLRNILDMGKIDQILGHSIGTTVEERMNNLVEIVEKKNLTGLTNNLFGTMQQNISNIGDFFTMFYKAIGDAGVFDSLASITGTVSTLLSEFDNQSGKLPKIAQIFSDAFNMMLEPIVAFTEGLANLVRNGLDFIIEHPAIGKFALMLFAVGSASAVALGWILKLSGSFMMLAGSIKLLGGVGNILNVLKLGLTKFGSSALLLGAVGTILYQAWKNNFMGIQDVTAKTIKKLDLMWTYFSTGELSQEQMDLAKQLGITDLLKNLDNLKLYMSSFSEGFSKGFNDFFTGMFSGIEKVNNAIKEFIGLDLGKYLKPIKDFFSNILGDGLSDTYKSIGGVAGKIAGLVVVMLPIYKILRKISGIGGVLGGLFGGRGSSSGGGGKSLTGGGGFNPKSTLKSMASVAVIIGGMGIIVTALGGLMSIPGADKLVGKGIGAVTSLMGAILPLVSAGGAFFLLTKEFTKLNINTTQVLSTMKNLAIAVGGLSALVAVVGLVSMIPFDIGRVAALTPVLAELGLVGLAIAAFAKLAGKLQVKDVAIGVANMAIALGAMTGVFSLLAWISTFNFDVSRVSNIVDIIMQLGAVGTAITALSGAIGAIEILTGGIAVGAIAAGLVTLAGVLTAMAGLMLLINSMTGSINLANLDLVMNMMLKFGAIGGALTVISAIAGIAIAPALLGIASIALVIRGLIEVAEMLSKFSSEAGKIQSGMDLLSTIGNGIGKAIGTFIGGIGEGVSASLPAIGSNIASFVNNLMPMFTALQGQDANAIGTFFSSLASALLKFTATDLLSFFTGGPDFANLGTQLSIFATNASGFFNTVASLPANGFENAKLLFQSLADIGNVPNTGGIAQWFSGTNDFAALADGLKDLGSERVVGFFNTVASIPANGFENAKNLFQSLADISNIPNTGGVAQWFSGTNDFDALSEKLPTFGTAMSEFYASISSITDFSKISSLFQALSDIGNIPNTGGVAQWFTGTNDISGVGASLKQFGADTKEFFENVNGLNTGNLTAVFDAVVKAGEVATIELSGLSTKGTELSNFMTNAKTFFAEAQGVAASAGSLDTLANSLQNFFNAIGTVATTNISTISTSVLNIQTQVQNVYNAITSLGTAVTGVQTTAMTLSNTLQSIKLEGGNIPLTAQDNVTPILNSILWKIQSTKGTITITATDNATPTINSISFALIGLSLMRASIAINATDNASGVISSVRGAIGGLSQEHNTNLNATDLVTNVCLTVTSSILAIPTEHSTTLMAIDNASSKIRSIVNALKNIPKTKTVKINAVQNGKIPGNAKGTDNFAGGLTWVNEQGGELIDLPSGTTIIPHDKSITEAMNRGYDLGQREVMSNTQPVEVQPTPVRNNGEDLRKLTKAIRQSGRTIPNAPNSENNGGNAYDYSVTFGKGSIIIQAPQGSSQVDWEQGAERIMKYIQRKQQKQAMARKRV